MNCCINSRLVDSCSGYTILILDYIVFRRLESVPNARKKIIENFLPKFFTCHFLSPSSCLLSHFPKTTWKFPFSLCDYHFCEKVRYTLYSFAHLFLFFLSFLCQIFWRVSRRTRPLYCCIN